MAPRLIVCCFSHSDARTVFYPNTTTLSPIVLSTNTIDVRSYLFERNSPLFPAAANQESKQTSPAVLSIMADELWRVELRCIRIIQFYWNIVLDCSRLDNNNDEPRVSILSPILSRFGFVVNKINDALSVRLIDAHHTHVGCYTHREREREKALADSIGFLRFPNNKVSMWDPNPLISLKINCAKRNHRRWYRVSFPIYAATMDFSLFRFVETSLLVKLCGGTHRSFSTTVHYSKAMNSRRRRKGEVGRD